MNLTPKQFEMLKLVVAGNDDGSMIDLDQLIERLSYRPSKQAIQFSIRAMIKHEMIEKCGMENRRERKRVLIGPTSLGRHMHAALTRPAYMEQETLSLEPL